MIPRALTWTFAGFARTEAPCLPKERCSMKGGVQRARYKAEVNSLAKSNHIFLGQILSTTPQADFWDEVNNHSRLKQYQLEKFLRAADNGWVNRKAQYYRGAYQVEDEENWGIQFFGWVLADKAHIKEDFFLLRQSAKDIPHSGDNNIAMRVRAESKAIADQYSPFMDLRVKLHGQPEESDLKKVETFYSNHKDKLTGSLNDQFVQLIADLRLLYQSININDINSYLSKLSSSSEAHQVLSQFIADYQKTSATMQKCVALSAAALGLRKSLLNKLTSSERLTVIDVSIKLEAILMRESSQWQPETLDEQMKKIYTLAQGATGFGYLELWEWEVLSKALTRPTGNTIVLKQLTAWFENARRSVEWAIGMIRAHYHDVVELYSGFEPLANGFFDDQVRSGILLNLGNAISRLGDFQAQAAGLSNSVMGVSNQSAFRGLNPGYAMGELVVMDQASEEMEVSPDKIYIFNRPPADLKPIAGIATVSEGNMVSHVQLLARNLGIPNAVLSLENLEELKKFNGQKVFYAVSNKGTVLMKSITEMTSTEKRLFETRKRSEERIRVPVDKLKLDETNVLNLRSVDASQSGILCGPKAANLGQLKQLFPDHVVEGLVIPFGIFKAHMDQPMPGTDGSYWDFLNNTFSQAGSLKDEGKTTGEIDQFVLGKLEILRNAIKQMPLLPSFRAGLEKAFRQVLGAQFGQVPVFLRSDTNMEDLKDFTGAGLNLTLFNVLEPEKITQGIKEVWASPYTERSYKWRQSYLLNPENVYPSILIIPSVNGDCSGVMITKGVSTGNTDDVTVAFNRGVGGAVEGQAAESWLLRGDGENVLLSPSREDTYTTLPSTGGTQKKFTPFNNRILKVAYLQDLRQLTQLLNEKLPAGSGMLGPYDVELGFKDDKIWLFQVRPFVENKKATSSEYLNSLTPSVDDQRVIPLNSKM